MNKKIIYLILILFSISGYSVAISTGKTLSSSIIEKIKITEKDIPEGFIYGQIPGFARKVLLNNPWEMNRAAINKLTKDIYPDGDANAVKSMHVSIITRKVKPYGDDIVCYIMVFNNSASGKKECEKLSQYSRYNSDRTIVVIHENIAVFILVHDVANYKYITEIEKIIEQRISAI